MLEQPFPSKVLLFGEHILMQGASALAIPCNLYSGVLRLSSKDYNYNTQNKKSNECLKAFYSHLQLTDKDIDIKRFSRHLSDGLFFDSSIPLGYGMGSSGALVAAIWATYQRKKNIPYVEIQKKLALMEAFFHGESSGIDPLVSLLNRSILVKKSILTLIDKHWDIYTFLIDSHISRQGASAITYFKSQWQSLPSQIKLNYIESNEACIQAWQNKHTDVFFEFLNKLSFFQFTYFKELIPPTLMDMWEMSLNNPNYTYKLCGAGAGGMILGFSTSSAQEIKHQHPNAKIYDVK